MVVSKDIWNGRGHPTDYNDINIGDNYTYLDYEAINKFYNSLSEVCSQNTNEFYVKRLIMLKKK